MITKRSVLLIDDSPFDLLLTRKMLERSGHFGDIYEATDGAEALAMFKNYEATQSKYNGNFPPLVILLDINMPLMDGFEFLKAYEGLEPERQGDTSIVVMLTSSNSGIDQDRALEFPSVKGYIVKPMNPTRADKLAATVFPHLQDANSE